MKNSRDNRIRRLFPLLVLTGLASSPSTVSAGVNVWTTSSGAAAGDIRALAIDPAHPSTLYAGTSGGGVFGCDSNGRFWIFGGGLTNISVDMTVTDTQTGAVQTYTNSQGTAFAPVQDTNAFATCP